MLDLMYRDKY